MGEKRQNSRRGELLAELEGNRRIILSGCRGIDLYTEECVRLRTATGTITVYGQRLEMGCMTVDGATITGRLQRIELTE
ncbi:MAG: YabP/YqfC family sporulation protein [Clostridia bacterium]|nr:YabP/YqfC family sporulation protein [Clostridia bacterium]